MKICLIGPVYPYRGGIAHYTTLLAQYLGREGHSVEVISFKSQFPKWLYPGKTDQDNSIKTLEVSAQYLLSPIDPLSWLKTVNQIEKIQPSIVLAMWWTTFWAPCYGTLAGLLKRKGLDLSLLIHNVVPHEARFYDLLLARFALNRITKHIVQTSQQDSRLRQINAKAEILRATHPVYSTFNNLDISREKARRELGVPEDALTVLFFGLVRPYKGLEVLLEALGKLIHNEKRLYLIIAGEFWEDEEKYRKVIMNRQMEERVKILNRYIPNEEVAIIFRASDVFAAPYVGGSQSGAVNIAVGFNLPIIMTDIISESVAPAIREHCLVVPSGDSDALAEAINSALSGDLTGPFSEELVDRSWQELIQTIELLAGGKGR